MFKGIKYINMAAIHIMDVYDFSNNYISYHKRWLSGDQKTFFYVGINYISSVDLYFTISHKCNFL